MKKRITFQTAEKRGRLKTEFTRKQESLDRSTTGTTGGSTGGGGGGGGGCHPCQGGTGNGSENCSETCTDTFTRSLTDEWGTSDIGPVWGNNGANGTFNVNGSHGTAIPGISSILATPYLDGTWLQAESPSYPVEAEIDFVVHRRFDPTSYTFYSGGFRFQVDEGTSPLSFNSAAGIAVDSKSTTLQIFMQGPAGETDTFTVWTSESDWEDVNLSMRVRFESGQSMARVWKTANGDPGGWQVTITHGTLDPFAYTKFSFSNFPGTYYGGPPGAYEFRIDKLRFLSGTGCGSSDDFDRSVPDSFGTGPLGEWITRPIASSIPERLHVDGEAGVYNDPSGDDAYFVSLDNSLLDSVPQEVLAHISVNFNLFTDIWEFDVGFDGVPDPLNSSNWTYAFMEAAVVGSYNPSGFNEWQLALDFVDSDLGSNGTIILTNISTGLLNNNLDPPQFGTLDFWVRLRIESGARRCRVWEDGETEPASWTDELTGSLTEIPTFTGILIQGSGDGDNTATMKLHSFEITEGGSIPCNQDIIDQQGNVIGTTPTEPTDPVQASDVLTGLIVTSTLRRSSPTVYTLPSSARHVLWITIDSVPSRFTFTSPNTITLPDSVSAGSIVVARYYSL